MSFRISVFEHVTERERGKEREGEHTRAKEQ